MEQQQQPRPERPDNRPDRPNDNGGQMLSQILGRVNEMKNLMQSEMLPKITRLGAAAQSNNGSLIPYEVNILTGSIIVLTMGMIIGLALAINSAVEFTNKTINDQAAVSNALIGLALFMTCMLVVFMIVFYFFLTG